MEPIFVLYEPPQGAPWWLPLAHMLIFLFFLLLPVLLRYVVFRRPSRGYALTLGPICGFFILIFSGLLFRINPNIKHEKAALISLCLLIGCCIYSCSIMYRGYREYSSNKSKVGETDKKLNVDKNNK